MKKIILLLALALVAALGGWLWMGLEGGGESAGLENPAGVTSIGEILGNRGMGLEEKKRALLGLSGLSGKARERLIARLEGRVRTSHRPDSPGEAARFHRLKRKDSSGRIPVEKYLRARARFAPKPFIRRSVAALGGFTSTWSNLGPHNVGGRTRALLVQPDGWLLAAGVAGGIWRSTDGGASWAPMDDLLPNLAVSTMAQQPDDLNVIYAGTGEGFYNGDGIRGAGILKSTDRGESWQLLGATGTSDFWYVNKIAASPSGALYAATRAGLFKSGDGGESWEKILSPSNGFPGFLDMAVQQVEGEDYLSVWDGWYGLQASHDGGENWAFSIGGEYNEILYRGAIAFSGSEPGTGYVSVAESSWYGDGGVVGIYKTTDYFRTPALQVLNFADTPRGRLNRQLFSYATYGFDTGEGNSCWDEGVEMKGLGWYANAIAVDPADSEVVWVGGVDLWRSDDGGRNFGMASTWWLDEATTSGLHADQHIIVFDPGYDGVDNTSLYFGNDGGIYRTTGARGATSDYPCHSWPDLETIPAIEYESLNNGYGVTQFYHGAASAQGGVVIGGTQDNGTLKYPGAGRDWVRILGGDGGNVAIDPTDPDLVYSTLNNLHIFRTTSGNANQIKISSGIDSGGEGLFIVPMEMDPNNPKRLYVANQKLWRTDDATAAEVEWVEMGYLSEHNGSAIAVAPGDSRTVYVGTADGYIFRKEAPRYPEAAARIEAPAPGGGSWNGPAKGAAAMGALALVLLLTAPQAAGRGAMKLRRAGLPGPTMLLLLTVMVLLSCRGSGGGRRGPDVPGYVSSLTVHPGDPRMVYATVSTFGAPHLWLSTNGGRRWNVVAGEGPNGIPDIPANDLFIDPDRTSELYLATDLGVLFSEDAGLTWESINTHNMANVVVEHLAYRAATRSLFAFTHGRGVYETRLP